MTYNSSTNPSAVRGAKKYRSKGNLIMEKLTKFKHKDPKRKVKLLNKKPKKK